MSAASEPIGRRDVIDRAWARSMMCGLNPGSPLDLPFAPPFDSDSTFTRAARPVMDYLGGLLPGSGTAAVLLDADGKLLVRVCDDPSLTRRMDDGSSLPGFVWSEEYAGANAVGIALEERVPTWTSGQDHYLEALRDLACAAVPIINPLSQRVVGVLDLTAQLSAASLLMLPMALQAARTIEQRLVDAAQDVHEVKRRSEPHGDRGRPARRVECVIGAVDPDHHRFRVVFHRHRVLLRCRGFVGHRR